MNPTAYPDLNNVPTDETLNAEHSIVDVASAENAEQPEAGPTGPDFTKPLRTVGTKHPVRMLTVNAGNKNFPVVALVEIAGVEVAMNFNLMGEDPTLDYVIENVPPLPAIVFGRLLRKHEDDSLVFDTATYPTETEALEATVHGAQLITTFAQVLTNVGTKESEETDEPDEGPQSLYVSGLRRDVKVGDTLQAYRNGYGTRRVRVLKLRTDPAHKSCYVQADDGSNPYWALNRNLR